MQKTIDVNEIHLNIGASFAFRYFNKFHRNPMGFRSRLISPPHRRHQIQLTIFKAIFIPLGKREERFAHYTEVNKKRKIHIRASLTLSSFLSFSLYVRVLLYARFLLFLYYSFRCCCCFFLSFFFFFILSVPTLIPSKLNVVQHRVVEHIQQKANPLFLRNIFRLNP